MRKVFFMLFVSLVIVSLASVSLAGEYRIVREKWDQNLRDLSTGELTPTYNGEWVQSVNGVPPRAGERGRGEDGKEYVWVEAGAERRLAQPAQQISRPPAPERRQVQNPTVSPTREHLAVQPQPRKNSPRPGELRCGSDGRVYQWKPARRVPLHPALVSYRLKKGETIATGTRDYTVEPSARKIMKATGITPGQDKRLPVNFPVAIPEKVLKPEYRDPLPKLKAAYEELDQLRAQTNSNVAQQKKIAELENYIQGYWKGSVEYVGKEEERFAAFRADVERQIEKKCKEMQSQSVPAVPANPAVAPPATQATPATQTPAKPATPDPSQDISVAPQEAKVPVKSAPPNPIPVIGGTENVAKKATTPDNWDDVLENDFGIKTEGKSRLAKK